MLHACVTFMISFNEHRFHLRKFVSMHFKLKWNLINTLESLDVFFGTETRNYFETCKDAANFLHQRFIYLFYFFQQIANIILILTSALIGFLCYILFEGKQRRAFVEAKQSLEVKTLIEEQSAEQVN